MASKPKKNVRVRLSIQGISGKLFEKMKFERQKIGILCQQTFWIEEAEKTVEKEKKWKFYSKT